MARHLAPLRRFVSGRLPRWARDMTDTDDLVQDTLLRTFTKIEEFDVRGIGALQAYLRTAVLNRVRDELRRKGRTPAMVDAGSVDLEGKGSPLEEAIGRKRSNAIRQRSRDSNPRNEKRSSRASRWTTRMRIWRRCSANRLRTPPGRLRSG